MSFKDNTAAMCEARKASPDWHGISVLSCLISFGAWMANGERDSARINAMSPKRQAKAAELFRIYLALHQEVNELRDEIENEIRESIK
tara:strand:+ start:2518 stop:2781 length:264 start_codon:yes stop_codon:yes gene_type:complete